MDDIEALWTQYKTAGGRHLRDQLIVHYTPLVRYVAGRVAVGLPQSVEQTDLASYGVFGLIDAIEKFDLDRGYKFETYAIARIRGAILDELRSIDWVPRSIRAKARAVERAHTKLEGELHRAPSDPEVAGELEITDDQLRGILAQIAAAGIVALDDNPTGETIAVRDTVADTGLEPVAAYEIEDLRTDLAGSLKRMPQREQRVLGLYYLAGLTLAEIGNVLGVTESRVCQIHTKAVEALKIWALADEH